MYSLFIAVGAVNVVTLRGLDFDGKGNVCSNQDTSFIVFSGAGVLHLERMRISNFKGNCSGINFAPTGAAKLFISDSTVTNNGGFGITSGILIKPASGVHADVTIDRTRIENNLFGILADGTGGGTVNGVVSDSVVSGNVNFGITASGSGTSVVLLVESTKIAGNTYGLVAVGAGAVMAVGKSSIMFNGTGLYTASGGAIGSFKNNNLGVNGTDGTFTAVAAQQ